MREVVEAGRKDKKEGHVNIEQSMANGGLVFLARFFGWIFLSPSLLRPRVPYRYASTTYGAVI
jgi:hypothetical protein